MLFGYEKESFLTLPTPLQKMQRLSQELECDIWLKRDDLTDFGMGGNKLRKLEYLLSEAKKQGATMLMTYGGAQTNHGRLTAAVAAKFGMKCAILCLDDAPQRVSGNILLDRLMGAEVYVKKSDGTDEAEQNRRFGREIMEKYEAQGEKIYEIPVGGSNPIGALGYYECGNELKKQMDQQGLQADHVICAAGSLGTYLGLWMGLRGSGYAGDICGVAISPFQEAKEHRLMEYYEQCCKAYGVEPTAGREDFHIEKGYVGEGYNSVDEQARKAIYLMASREAVLLDPCYTGKAFGGVLQMIEAGKIKKGATLVFLHTGGSPALYNPKHEDIMVEELTRTGYHVL